MNLTAECPCSLPPALLENVTEHPLEIELKNSSLLYQLRRRATHSRDAFEASLYIFGLTGLVVISVLMSKMWRTKSLEAKRKIYYPQGPKDQILVKDMLKKRAKSFMQYFKKTKKRRKSDNDDIVDYSTYLRMDTFFDSEVDSNHVRFLESSEDDEDTSVLVWDKRKGDWIAYESDEDDDPDPDQDCVEYHFDQPENVCSEVEESDNDSDSPLIRV